jgi:hypothetical protein
VLPHAGPAPTPIKFLRFLTIANKHGLTRIAAKKAQSDDPEEGPKLRLKWQASHPGALWHGDVCHFAIFDTGIKTPVRI